MSKQSIVDWPDNPQDALNQFLADFRDVFQCIDQDANVYYAPAVHHSSTRIAVKVETRSRIRNERGIPLIVLVDGAGDYLYFQAIQQVQIRVLEGKYTVSTRHYIYQIQDTPQTKVLGWHYHPEDPISPIPYPHLQIFRDSQEGWYRSLKKKHIPTGRVSAERIVEFLITELNVQPANLNWRSVIERTEYNFEERKTWGHKEPPV
ncbi:MAG: hypothetical protein R3F51_25700 [Cyanobacteriota/Melainabacteria group bacterium]